MHADASVETNSASFDASWTRLDLVLLMAGALLLYSLNVDFTMFGDAAMYSDYVLLRKFDELTLHLGYYAFLFVSHTLLNGVFGVPIQESAVWLNVVAATLSVGAAYLLGRELLGTRHDAFLCAVIFGLSGRVFANATTSEIYMLQTLFVLSSFYCFARERVMLSGLMCGVSMLVSPLSAFAFLFYPVFDYQRAGKVRWSVLIRLAVAGLLVYLPYLIVHGRELLFGVRGLLVINHVVRVDPIRSLANFPTYQFKAFTVLLLLIVPALLAARTNKRMFALALAVAIPHIYIILKLTGEDHVFILNTDFFFGCCLVIGWRELERARIGRVIAPLLLAGHVGLFVGAGIIHRFDPHRGYAEEMRRIAQTYLLGHDAIMVTDWSRAVGLTFFGRPTLTTTVHKDPLFQNQIFDLEFRPMPSLARLDRGEVYVLDAWEPSPLSRLLRSRKSLEAARRDNSVVAIADRALKLQCTLIEETVHRIYRCVRRTT